MHSLGPAPVSVLFTLLCLYVVVVLITFTTCEVSVSLLRSFCDHGMVVGVGVVVVVRGEGSQPSQQTRTSWSSLVVTPSPGPAPVSLPMFCVYEPCKNLDDVYVFEV